MPKPKNKPRSSHASKSKPVEQTKARMVLWITITGVLIVGGFLFVINYLHNPFEFGFASHKDHSLMLFTVDRFEKGMPAQSLDATALIFRNVASDYSQLFPFCSAILASVNRQTPPLEESSMTLAELLKTRDYATAAFLSSPDLDPSTGLDQGFDVYKYGFDVSKNMNEISSWLSRNPKHFLWVHSGKSISEKLIQANAIVILIEAQGKESIYISLPGGKNKEVKQQVNHLDILPTVIEWLGIPAYPAMKGRSLIPMLQGKES